MVEVEDRPGVLADLTRKIAKAGVNLDLVYVATRNRVVFGADDLAALRPHWRRYHPARERRFESRITKA